MKYINSYTTEEMKYINFYRENNKFDDILNDANIKKHVKEKIRWYCHLSIGLPTEDERILSYITLKYGDEMRNKLCDDYSPIPNVDYIPKRK